MRVLHRTDAWGELHPRDPGLTFDFRCNPMLDPRNPKDCYRSRLDRAFCCVGKDWRLGGMEVWFAAARFRSTATSSSGGAYSLGGLAHRSGGGGRRLGQHRAALPEAFPAPHLRNLILVACHSVYTGLDFRHMEEDSSWFLLEYQKVPGQTHSFVQHIQLGVEQAAADPSALLLFSGGKTRREAGPRAEGEGYWMVTAEGRLVRAQAPQYHSPGLTGRVYSLQGGGPSGRGEAGPRAEGEGYWMVAEAAGWYGHKGVRERTFTEDHARDSFENLLFGLCRFYELTGHYPDNILVVGYEFKRERFLQLHRAAVGFPQPRFEYVGTPALNKGALQGEAKTVAAFRKDPYGCGDDLSAKRATRDPFSHGGMSRERCPALGELLDHCGPGLYPAERLPWGQAWAQGGEGGEDAGGQQEILNAAGGVVVDSLSMADNNEEFVPDEDFAEVDISESLQEDEAATEEEYDTEDEAPAEALENETAKIIARKEKERLKLQDRLRREQLEKFREQQNEDVVRMFKTNYRLLITGTPLQNNLHELWALLNFLLPEVFSSAEKFDEWFTLGADKKFDEWFTLGADSKEGEAEVVQQLHKVLRPFLLRRLKADVEKGLPPKKETILKIGMSEMQRKYYAALLQKDMDAVTGGADRSRLLNIVMQLRKCCGHPYLFQGAEPGPPYVTGEHLVENSGKMVLLDKLLPKLKQRGSRILIFSQMTRMIDILEDYCLYRQFQYCRIDGNTSGEDREAQIDEYNRDGSEKFIFLLSTRAGGLGINLYTADIVVLFDSDWNPQMDLQAMDRAHRIGQKKEVQVFRFCTENSIEEKVIEKAYKKLRLDALVIQQGRLVENTKTVNKDDLLNMVRYGAEMVFSSSALNITDEDIDAIIQKGERDTAALNNKLKEFTENAMKFTLDGGISAYEFDDDKEPENQDQIDQLKALMGANWVDPPKRERKRLVNYAENEFYRQALAKREYGPRSGGPRLPKMPQLQDFQFFNVSRLTELYERDHAAEAHRLAVQQKEAAARAQVGASERAAGVVLTAELLRGPVADELVMISGGCVDRQKGASDETIAKEVLAPQPDDPQPLTEEEIKERERLLEEGFSNWTRREFNAFVRACEKYGRAAVADVAREIEGKTEDEVREYSRVFWQRYQELNDWERIIKNIERGEQRIQRQADIMAAIAAKLERYKNPWQELRIQYGPAKGKAYTEEEDRFLVCMMHKLGYGAWDELKAEIRNHWRFRFDWFFKSRTPQELARRCETLIRLIEKENEDEEGGAAGPKKRGGAGRKKAAEEGGTGSQAPSEAGGASRKRKPSESAGGAAATSKRTK
ncbi:hypothetical protein N2152v2_003552 [Parachlorella kessleri]